MTGPALAALAVAGAAALVDWVAVARRSRRLEYAAKPAVMLGMLAAAMALRPADPAQRTWLVAGLALSLLGDVFLMLEERLFPLGLGSFLLAHLAYIVAFVQRGLEAAVVGAALVAVALASLLVARPMVRALAGAGRGSLAGAVAVYVAAIGLMLAAAAGTLIPAAIAGAALFYASDGMLGWNRFVRPFAPARLGVIVTYHLAQALLVLSLVERPL